MLFINKPLTAGAMTRAIMTATEAKTAALQELAVNYTYTDAGYADDILAKPDKTSTVNINGNRLTQGAVQQAEY